MALVELKIPGIPSGPFPSKGNTIREALESLVVHNPELRDSIFTKRGRLHRSVQILWNDKAIKNLKGDETFPATESDKITVLPAAPRDLQIEARERIRDVDLPPTLAPELDRTTLRITLSSPEHTINDVSFVVGAVNNLVMASIWGYLKYDDHKDEMLNWARSTLQNSLGASPKSTERYFPNLSQNLFTNGFSREFDALDPLDVGVQVGLNALLCRVLERNSRARYERLFSFARIVRLEQKSPLLLETTAVIGGALALPSILYAATMVAVNRFRRSEAEAGIRETELELKQEELKQSRIRTRVQEHIAAAIVESQFSNVPREIPEAVIAETARIATTSIADLGKSPIVGSINVGFSKGK